MYVHQILVLYRINVILSHLEMIWSCIKILLNTASELNNTFLGYYVKVLIFIR